MIINQIRKGVSRKLQYSNNPYSSASGYFPTLFDHVIQKFIFYALLRQLQPKKLKR